MTPPVPDRVVPSIASWAGMALALLGAVFTIAESPSIESLLFGAMFIAFPAVGLVLRSKVPDNPIGGLLVTVGALAGIGGLGSALILLSRPDSFAAGVARWTQTWVFYPVIGVVLVLLLLFPGGGLVSPRWRWGLWSAGLFVAMASVGAGFHPWPRQEGGPNPLAVDSLADTWLLLQDAAGIPLFVAALTGIASVVVRYRRGDEVERHQLKWFLAASALLPAAIAVGDEYRETQGIIVPIAFMLFPVAIGVAITRYRLFDIDRIISRTVSYVLVTAALAAVYVTLVFGFRFLAPGESDVAVVASTLAAAALFNPLRRRTQALVDRRFNRSRYDAARVVDMFGARIRTEEEMGRLAHQLLETAGRTMQPRSVSIWIREQS